MVAPSWMSRAQLRPEVLDGYRNAPPHMIAEILAGELRRMPRPRPAHAGAASALGEELGPPFRRGRGGPGGWIFLDEPELHLGPTPDAVVPDIAGWHRARLPETVFAAGAPVGVTVAPDWVCEVLSPSTEATDRAEKMPIYAREKVAHAWLVDPDDPHAGGVPVRARDVGRGGGVPRRRGGQGGALRRRRARARRPLAAVGRRRRA